MHLFLIVSNTTNLLILFILLNFHAPKNIKALKTIADLIFTETSLGLTLRALPTLKEFIKGKDFLSLAQALAHGAHQDLYGE